MKRLDGPAAILVVITLLSGCSETVTKESLSAKCTEQDRERFVRECLGAGGKTAQLSSSAEGRQGCSGQSGSSGVSGQCGIMTSSKCALVCNKNDSDDGDDEMVAIGHGR